MMEQQIVIDLAPPKTRPASPSILSRPPTVGTARRARAAGRCAAVGEGERLSGVGLDKAAPALWAAGAGIFFVAPSGQRDLPRGAC